MASKASAAKPRSDLAYLCRALKAPSLAAALDRLAQRARADGWTHEEFLAACLEREVAARQDHGGEGRIKAAHFPARKLLEDFDYDPPALPETRSGATWAHSTSSKAGTTSCSSGPPGTGKTHLAVGLSIRACQAGHRVAFATAAEWVARLTDTHNQGRLHSELTRLGRIPLIVIDEVGYISDSCGSGRCPSPGCVAWRHPSQPNTTSHAVQRRPVPYRSSKNRL